MVDSLQRMTISEIQSTGLGILKSIHLFCAEHGIRYSVYGGTMLGMIRHGGFIPWDDDIDLAMPRPDYERFIKMYFDDRGGYRLFCYELGNSYLPYARVCEMNKTLVTSENLPWTPYESGVWVDVFPLDGASDDFSLAEKKMLYLKKQLEHLNDYRLSKGTSFFKKTNWHYRKRFLLSKLFFLRNRQIKPEDICPGIIEVSKETPFGSTKHFCNYSFVNFGMREYQGVEQFDSLVLKPFEDTDLYCISNHDEHLRNKYGDYWVLPPENERKGHGGYKFYWKIAR